MKITFCFIIINEELTVSVYIQQDVMMYGVSINDDLVTLTPVDEGRSETAVGHLQGNSRGHPPVPVV